VRWKTLKRPLGKMIVDLGQNAVGWIRVSVDGPKGTSINFQFVEVLEDGENVTRTPRECKAKDILVLSGDGRAEWEPKFAFHGFRYVEVENWPGKLEIGDIKGTLVHTDIRETGSFSCSNHLLNSTSCFPDSWECLGDDISTLIHHLTILSQI